MDNKTTERRLITSGSVFEEKAGYSRAVCSDPWVFVAGTTGFNYDTMEISDDVVEQCRQTLQNIGKVLAQAQSGFEDVVRVTYIFPHSEDFELCWPVLREYFGDIRPACTMYSANLADSRMKVEIEVTALKR
ncbi:MAG: RidA family protein [Acidiferrobacterales bacterium]|nr:RidA family protein [Acidiferrobacterales bacterium]